MNYEIKELNKKNKTDINEIITLVDEKYNDRLNNIYDDVFNNILENQLDYDENYTKKELELIAGYYNISKRKKTKASLIQDIVLFESDPTNIEISEKRKLMWFYFDEIKNDRYLKKFIISK